MASGGAARSDDRWQLPGAEPSSGAATAGGATAGGAGRGWVPDPPVPPDADVRAVVARSTSVALEAAATAYSAAHGHPLEHRYPGAGRRRRWHLSVRLAVVAGAAIAVLGAGVAARATLAIPAVTAPDAAVVPLGSAVPGPTADGSTRRPTPTRPTTVGAAGADPTGVSSAATGQLDQAGLVVVHVVGQVKAPGIVELPAGSRVSDAVAAAGATAAADLAALNLARVVVDGEQIMVPAPGETVPGPSRRASAAGSGSAPPVDLNSADAAALDALPGIGPVLAQRVLDWRTAHGRFTDVAELGEVPGIGDALLAKLRDLVRV